MFNCVCPLSGAFGLGFLQSVQDWHTLVVVNTQLLQYTVHQQCTTVFEVIQLICVRSRLKCRWPLFTEKLYILGSTCIFYLFFSPLKDSMVCVQSIKGSLHYVMFGSLAVKKQTCFACALAVQMIMILWSTSHKIFTTRLPEVK